MCQRQRKEGAGILQDTMDEIYSYPGGYQLKLMPVMTLKQKAGSHCGFPEMYGKCELTNWDRQQSIVFPKAIIHTLKFS